MNSIYRWPMPWLLFCLVTCCIACDSGDEDDVSGGGTGDDVADDDAGNDDNETADDDDDDDNDDDDNDTSAGDDDNLDGLQDLFDEIDVSRYIGLQYESSSPGPNGYTYYTYSRDDCRCTFGTKMRVAVHPGTENKVMLFMEGGGATWPGGGFAVPLNYPWDIGFKSFDEDNPLHDWSFVYVPHCDHSIHSGDNQLMENGGMRYHHGLRQVSAAVTLMLDLFPKPEKILVAGSSAGGYGTYLGWAVVKSQYMDVNTYIMNDSGTGFWDPDNPETWEVIKEAWNIQIPEECFKCNGTIQTYLYELYLENDPQLRIGLFSSYRDWIISTWFLGMDQDRFAEVLMDVTDEIHADHPARFKRFFVKGMTHTTYEFLLPGGPHRAIRGTTLYDWIGQLVNEDPAWRDLLE